MIEVSENNSSSEDAEDQIDSTKVKKPMRKRSTITLDKRIFNAMKYQNAEEEENLRRKKILIVDD